MAIKGIDISHHQGAPDFRRVKAAGIGYVILKATEGINYIDPCFKANAAAALAAGLPIGAYHFLRATPIDEQCADFLEAINPYRLAWPVAIDVENPTKDGKVIPEVSNLGKAGITDRVITFAAAMRKAGCQNILCYSSKSWFDSLIDLPRVRAAGIGPWLAWYRTGITPDNTDRSGLCTVWQYTSGGTVPGIDGPVDMNASYQDFGTPPYTIDTTTDVEIKLGKCYTAKTTGEVELVAGTPGRVQIIKCWQPKLGYTLWHIVPTGRPGETVGIYPKGRTERLFKVAIK